MKLMMATLTAVALLTAAAPAQEHQAEMPEVFDVLKAKPTEGEGSISSAVDTFDGAVRKAENGDIAAIDSNLEYNTKRLQNLKTRQAAQAEYVEHFWEKAAVYFERMREQFKGKEDSLEYRKAVISLREEYQQREADAKAELERLNGDIAKTEARVAELSGRGDIAKLTRDMRENGLPSGPDDGAAPAKVPARADEAIKTMTDLAKRKTDTRVRQLVGALSIHRTSDDYFRKQVEEMTGAR